MTDRRTEGASLIERAAALYDFMAYLPAGTAAPARDAVPAPEPAPVRVMAQEPAVEAVPDAARVPEAAPVAGPSGIVDVAGLAEAGFIIPGAPVSAIAEEFRIAKRHLLLDAAGAARNRMILISSAQPGEGKSFCALNLALSMASERDVEVLIVDADFAKPSILSTLGLAGGAGLMDAIADPEVDVERLIVRTDIPRLSVLPAGARSHEDTEYLASARTAAVLDGLVASHPARIVLFDSPPVLAASPASVLALHVGQTLVVVRADRTGEGELREAVALLSGCADVKLLLNDVTLPAGGQRFGSYYGYAR